MTNNPVRYLRNPGFIFRKVVDEMILVPIHQKVDEMDSIYTLNDVGAFIWENLREPRSFTDLESALKEAYDAPEDQISADLEQFLGTLMAFDAVVKQ
jgi:hypothetical protein